MFVNGKISPFNDQKCIKHLEKSYEDLKKTEKQNISYNGKIILKTLSLAHSRDLMTRPDTNKGLLWGVKSHFKNNSTNLNIIFLIRTWKLIRNHFSTIFQDVWPNIQRDYKIFWEIRGLRKSQREWT